jgi:hypothetical protein
MTGMSVSGYDADDKVFVSILGLPSYETITDALDHLTFSGASVALTAAEVNSGLTLNSTYTGTGHPVSKLKVTALDTTSGGEAVSSASQTITVTDPPAGQQAALLAQSMAALGGGSPSSSGSLLPTTLADPTLTLAHPSH